MRWHAQPVVLLLRGWPDSAGPSGQACFDAHLKCPVIATVQLLGNGKAAIQGLKGEESMPMHRQNYLDLLDLLLTDFGVQLLGSVRHGKDTEHETGPMPLV